MTAFVCGRRHSVDVLFAVGVVLLATVLGVVLLAVPGVDSAVLGGLGTAYVLAFDVRMLGDGRGYNWGESGGVGEDLACTEGIEVRIER